MKDKRRLVRRERAKRRPKKKLAYGLVAVVAVVAFVCLLIYFRQPSQTVHPDTGSPKAAIVDHLSLTAPNPNFKEEATNILEQAGYAVEYYPGEEVKVDFYRNLPTHDYDLIILRVHSAITAGSHSLGLFTSEPYSKNKYVYEQLTDQLVGAAYSEEERERGITYFAIGPPFVTGAMKGRFENTTIIMMGCEGLTYTLMAEAFIENGAKVYISWNGPVSADHTDQATLYLLQHLIIEEQTLKNALRETFEQVGQDPIYDSILLYYPIEAEDYIITNTLSPLTVNVAKTHTQIRISIKEEESLP